jgi:hypothetical protein
MMAQSQIPPNSWAFTSDTLLPDNPPLPQSYILVLDKFFTIVDQVTQNPEAAKQLPALFTPDGIWKTPSAAFRGAEEIAQMGYTWTFLAERNSMRHWVTKLFSNPRAPEEVMLLGRLLIDNKDGTEVDVVWSAWIIFAEGGEDGHLLKFFQGWSSRV